ncbi:MAG: recombination mediator RecR [Cytophagaceae bacterium]|nr:recombination mediator RecR [Cytophagaceae bacterium]
MHHQYPSILLESAVNELSRLPGVGKKTALRLALHLLKQDKQDVIRFAEAIRNFREEIRYCSCCYNISDTEICSICASAKRNHRVVCVVETIRDVMAIENTGQHQGIYHVLGGIISPMDGIGPDDLTVDRLEERVKRGDVDEVIFALSATIEGDTTNFYLFRKLSVYPVQITAIARGVSVGDELEYADEITLGRSIINRLPFEKTI